MLKRVRFLLPAAVLAGCAGSARLLGSTPPGAADVETLIAQAPLALDENIRAVVLERGENASVHLVQIRDREEPHVHTRYDLTVVLVDGKGTLFVHDVALAMSVGDIAFVPKGTPHFFVNEGSEPAAALVSFAPAFEGADQQPVP